MREVSVFLFLAALSAGQPEIIKPDNTEMEQQVETTVSLRCKVRGFPDPRVEWTTSDGKVRDIVGSATASTEMWI